MKKLFMLFSVILLAIGCLASFPSVTSGVVPLVKSLPVPPSGELYSVSLSTTLQGLRDCLTGSFGTGIFANPARPDSLIFVWRISNGFAFVGLNIDPKTMQNDLMSIKANFANIKDYPGIIKALMQTGWTSVSYKFIEGTMRNPILIATINKIMEGISTRFVTFLIMPLGVNPGQIGAVDYARISPDDCQQ